MTQEEDIDISAFLTPKQATSASRIMGRVSFFRVDPTHADYPLGFGETVEWFAEPVEVGHNPADPTTRLLAFGISNALGIRCFDALVVRYSPGNSICLLWGRMLKFSQPSPFTTNEAGLAELSQRYGLR